MTFHHETQENVLLPKIKRFFALRNSHNGYYISLICSDAWAIWGSRICAYVPQGHDAGTSVYGLPNVTTLTTLKTEDKHKIFFNQVTQQTEIWQYNTNTSALTWETLAAPPGVMQWLPLPQTLQSPPLYLHDSAPMKRENIHMMKTLHERHRHSLCPVLRPLS